MGADVQAADEAGELITGRRLIANFLTVLPLIEKAARKVSRRSHRAQRAAMIAAKYATHIDNGWTIMLLDDLRKAQDHAASVKRQTAHYNAWLDKVAKLNRTQEGRRELARRAHWTDVRWRGDEISSVHVRYPGYYGE